MDHISQLKKIRAEAVARLRNGPDFKLAGRLGQLIVELGDTVDDAIAFDVSGLPESTLVIDAHKTVDEAEAKSETQAELSDAESDDDTIELDDAVVVEEQVANGATTSPRSMFATGNGSHDGTSTSSSVVSSAESVFSAARAFETTFAQSENSDVADDEDEEMIEELVAEIEGDAADLDTIMADDDAAPTGMVSSILNTNLSGARYANGVSH